MATGDFAQKLGLALKAINLSRSRLAQSAGVDKSAVTRWASGVQVPSDHNLSKLTEAVARHRPGFRQRDWDLDAEQFTHRLDVLDAGPSRHAAPSIAVLPFTNMSGDPEQAYFADGLAEDLIAVLWLSGRHDEARKAAREYIEMLPTFSLRQARKVSPVRGTPGQERYFDALRAAGLPD